MESSVLALGIPMAAPPARADGPSLRRDSHDGFGDMLGRALHQDGPAPEPGNASPRRPAEDAKPDAPEWAHAGTAPLHAPTPAPSKYQPSRPADAGAVDPPVSDAPAPQKLGNSGRRREDSADLTDLSNRAPDPAEPALAAVGQPAPSADAPISPGLPGRVAGLVDEEPDDLCGEELTQVVDALFETAEAVEGDTAAAVPTAQVAAELPVSDTRGAMPPQVPAHSSGEVQDVSVTGPDRPAPFGDRVQPEARPEGLRGAIPARPAAAAVAGRAGVLPDDAVAAPQDTAAAAQNLGDPGLTRRLAATAAGLVEALPDAVQNAAAAPPAPAAPPAVLLDALRGARATVNQVQPSQAWPTWSAAAAAMAARAGVLPDDAVAAFQDTAAAASAVQAYEQQAAAPRGGDWSAEFMAAGNELLRAALSAMSHTAGGDSAQSDSSSGNGSRRGTFVPLAQVAAAFGRSAVGPDSSWALAMAAGSRPAAGADAQDLGSESPVNGPSLTRSLVQTVRVQVRQGGGEAHIRLNPEHLGELSVLVKVDGSRVSATLRAESPLVRSWIEAHQQELRAALKEQGLSLDDLVIDADGRSRQEADAQAQQQRHSTPRRQMSGQQFDALI